MKFFVTNLRLNKENKRKHFYVDGKDSNDALNKAFRKLKHVDFHIKEAIKKVSDSFYNDLGALREKYPMVYFEAWTPDDFDISTDDKKTDWNDSKHVETVDELNASFDAEYGTNWDRVREASMQNETT